MAIKETYRISTNSTREINNVLSFIADRLDRLEGWRGTPEFQADVSLEGNQLTEVAEGVLDDDGVSFSQLDGLDSLTDNSVADDLHRHSKLVGSDGTPDPAVNVDTEGRAGIGSPIIQGWGDSIEVFQFGDDIGVFAWNNQIMGFSAGMYYDGTDWKYSQSGKGAVIADANIQSTKGTFLAHAIASGVKGGIISSNDWKSIYFNSDGFLGIDNAAPSSPLDIKADQSQFIRLDRTANAGINDIGVIGVTAVTGVGDDYIYIGTPAAAIMSLSFNSKYVGIGTSNPLVPLHVTGNVGIQSNSDGLLYGNSLDRKIYFNGTHSSFIDASTKWLFQDNLTNNTAKSAIFGTTAYVSAQNPFSIFLATSQAAVNYVLVGGGSASSQAATGIFFYTASAVNTVAGTQRAVIDGSGQFGIGSAAPTLLFDVTQKMGISPLGGLCVKLTNKTGGVTVQGQLVKPDTAVNDAFILCATSDQEVMGVILEAGVADGSEAWVVVAGIADVAFEDNTAAARQDWVSVSTTDAGYAVGAAAAPGAVVGHFREVGHCIESVAAGGAGTRILARCVIHFN
jgi:hypothetical protein